MERKERNWELVSSRRITREPKSLLLPSQDSRKIQPLPVGVEKRLLTTPPGGGCDDDEGVETNPSFRAWVLGAGRGMEEPTRQTREADEASLGIWQVFGPAPKPDLSLSMGHRKRNGQGFGYPSKWWMDVLRDSPQS